MFDHLSESGIYTEADLEPFSKRLAELRAIIRKDAEGGKHPPALTKLMMRKLEGCEKTLASLLGTLKVLSVELVPLHQRLIAVRRQIVAAAAKPKLPRAEVKQLQEELRKIDSKRVDGKFLGPGGSSVPAGQAILVGILEECFEICHEINVRNDEVPMTLQPIYDRLTEIKASLEHLVLMHRWTLRETDLWNYQVTLKEIDRMRVDGKFVDSEGKQPEGQAVSQLSLSCLARPLADSRSYLQVLLYLLRRCYGLIYKLVASAEPISEELMPISNKLSTISKCLKEVSKYGGPYTMRDLYPYRLALHQIDGLRTTIKDKDGNDTGVKKWLGRDGSLPEGQAILRAQFEEVEQTIEEMLNQEEEDDDDEEDEDDEEGGDWDESSAYSGAVTESSYLPSDDGGFSASVSMPPSPAPGYAASPLGFGFPTSIAPPALAGLRGTSTQGVSIPGANGGQPHPPGDHSNAVYGSSASTSGASPSLLATSPLARGGAFAPPPPLELGQNRAAATTTSQPQPPASTASASPEVAKAGPSVIGPGGDIVDHLPGVSPVVVPPREFKHAQPHSRQTSYQQSHLPQDGVRSISPAASSERGAEAAKSPPSLGAVAAEARGQGAALDARGVEQLQQSLGNVDLEADRV